MNNCNDTVCRGSSKSNNSPVSERMAALVGWRGGCSHVGVLNYCFSVVKKCRHEIDRE